MTAPVAYPLSWPKGRPRTPESKRRYPAFSRRETQTRSYGDGSSYTYSTKKWLTIADARVRLQEELRKLGARLPVVSTNVELKKNGDPYSDRKSPDDPGVAVYFQLNDKPIVFACDTFKTVADNMTAIAKHLEAMRAMERYGVGSLEQMFAGFTALPPASSVNDWRAALGDPKTLAEAEESYRDQARTTHPDVGGSNAQMAALNAAIAMARAHFKRT